MFYNRNSLSMNILVALSGGIDSSVTAHLLKEEGHDVVGVRFTLWNDPLAPALAKVLPSKCCNTQTAARAKSVAETLEIPYHIEDLEEEFKREVVDPFLEAHRKGLTPNPCIRCNQTIKFGRLLEIADNLGCEKIATGHYARVESERVDPSTTLRATSSSGVMVSVVEPDTYHLLEAIDKTKDQSYYLYSLTQEQLARVIFPLGTLQKREVYALARKYGVPFEEDSYRESQDLCFFPEKTPQAFLKRHLKAHLKTGKIVRKNGTTVGTHQGLPLYTIGQRRGLGIGGLKIPLEVVHKNYTSNTLVVEEQGRETVTTLPLHDLRWIAEKPDEGTPLAFECRTRSLAQRTPGRLIYRGQTGSFHCDRPLPSQAPGQHLVLYQGEEVIGGGVIGSSVAE